MRRTCLAMLLVFLVASCGGDEGTPVDQPGKTPEGGGSGEISSLTPREGTAPKEPEKPAPKPVPIDPTKALESLAKDALASDDPEVQLEAIDKIATGKGDRDRRARMVAQFLESDDPDVRSTAAGAVGKLEVKSVATNLRSLLAREKDNLVRKEALVSLFALEGSGATTDLIKVLENLDEHYSVRVSACQLIGRTKNDRGINPLVKVLEEDFNEAVRRECVAALSALKARRAVPQITEALKDANALVRTEAAKALGVLKAKKSVEALVDALDMEEEDDVQVLEAVTRALGAIVGLDEDEMEDYLITGNHTEAQQNAAVANWQEWWEENKVDYE